MEITPPIDLVQHAKGVYNFEQLLDADHDAALNSAITAVLELHRAQVISEVADHVETYSETLFDADQDADANLASDYVLYVANELIRKLGVPEAEISTYEPKKGDVIQIIMSGTVHVPVIDSRHWSLRLDRGETLDFNLGRKETGVRVRLLDRE